jgi:hypothetical protein
MLFFCMLAKHIIVDDVFFPHKKITSRTITVESAVRFFMFFGELECVGHSFAFVAHFVF